MGIAAGQACPKINQQLLLVMMVMVMVMIVALLDCCKSVCHANILFPEELHIMCA